jgi:hypothetical protein
VIGNEKSNFSLKISTDEGRRISIKPFSLNAISSIHDNRDPDSNQIEESDPQSQKHSLPKTSSDAGIMISTKPVRLNAHFSIRDNLDPDSNVTEESNLHSEKHPSPKTSIDLGIRTNVKPVFENADVAMCSNLDPFSKTTDFNPSLSETHSEPRNSVGEGIHKLLPEKVPQLTAETERITPLTTINRGQNSFVISQTTLEVCDLGFAIEVEMEGSTFNGHDEVK